MRVHKTKYSNLTNEELLQLADQQGFNVSEIGLELMSRLSEAVDTINKLQNENADLKNKRDGWEKQWIPMNS